MSSRILIYQDYIHSAGLLHRALTESFGHDAVRYADADDILGGILQENIAAFFMPGGADLYYCEKLNGAGNTNIRTYVEDGGIYVGICAGAYYGSRALAWAEDNPEKSICGRRELDFFPGTAVGPVKTFLGGGDWQTHAAAVNLVSRRGLISPSLYWGGPVLIPEETADGYEVLARYADLDGQPAALVQCQIGKGTAFLAATHVESGARLLRKKSYQTDKACKNLSAVAQSLLDIDPFWEGITAFIKNKAFKSHAA